MIDNHMFQPGDVIAFAGNNLISRVIVAGTFPGLPLAITIALAVAWWFSLGPVACLVGFTAAAVICYFLARWFGWLPVSHVGICSIFKKDIYPDGGVLLVESTTLCDEPCELTGLRINGVQAHRPERRIANYAGRVYILRPSKNYPFSEGMVWKLAYYANKWIGTPYDTDGAIRSATHLPSSGSDDEVFCDDLVAVLLMNTERLARGNPKSYTPASLVRTLVRTGVYRRWQRVLIFPTLIWLGSAGLLSASAAGGNQEPAWINVPPVKQFFNPRLGRVLSDIESHLPDGHRYAEPDLVGWGHETTHGINSRIRNTLGRQTGTDNAVYVLGNRGLILPEPKIRLSMVGRFVPQEFRDDSFQLYLVQQAAHWEFQPLYVLDDWTAYTNGTSVAVEHAEAGRPLDSQTETVENMLEFCAFAAGLLIAVKQYDPGYQAFEQLERFVRWNVLRSLDLARRARRFPTMFHGRSAMLLESIERRIGATK